MAAEEGSAAFVWAFGLVADAERRAPLTLPPPSGGRPLAALAWGAWNPRLPADAEADSGGALAVAHGADFSLRLGADGAVSAAGRAAPPAGGDATGGRPSGSGGSSSSGDDDGPSSSSSSEEDERSSAAAGWPPVWRLVDLGAGVRVAAVAAGEGHCLALSADGRVFSWGSDSDGQCGRGGGAGRRVGVAVIAGPGSPAGAAEPAAAGRCAAITAGARHTAVATARGDVLCCGWNGHGQCGTADAAACGAPALVRALGGVAVVALAAGLAHTVALSDAGDAYAWGWNSDGQLGTGAEESSPAPLLLEAACLEAERLVGVACGARHTLLLAASGAAYACGLGDHGQLGDGGGGGGKGRRVPARIPIPDGARVAGVAGSSGGWHSLLLLQPRQPPAAAGD